MTDLEIPDLANDVLLKLANAKPEDRAEVVETALTSIFWAGFYAAAIA